MDTIDKIKCMPTFKEEYYSYSLKTIPLIFADIPASGSSFFLLVEMEVLANTSSRLEYAEFVFISNRVLLFRAFFLLPESITEISFKPVL